MRRTELPVRSDKVDLAALASGVVMPPDSAFKVLLDTASEDAAWRLIEAYSARDLPFELYLEWSGGRTFGAHARVTVPTASRICVLARHLGVRAANLANEANAVGVSVGDAFAETRNFYEWRGACDGATATQITVPPFAVLAHVNIDDQALLVTTDVSVLDGTLTRRAQMRAGGIPDSGLPLGGARKIEVQSPSAANIRALFALSF